MKYAESRSQRQVCRRPPLPEERRFTLKNGAWVPLVTPNKVRHGAWLKSEAM